MAATISYEQHDLGEEWDGIVIGSGFGGLATAAILAREGYKMLVLERYSKAGGRTLAFERAGYEWPLGLYYVGEMEREDALLPRVFDYITDGGLEWTSMGEVFDRICFGDQVYKFYSGLEAFKAGHKERFPAPADQRAIDEYVDLVIEVADAGQKFFMEKALPPMLGRLIGWPLRRKFMTYARRTTLEVMRELTSNERLIGVLCGQWPDFGTTPGESSFTMHAILVNHFLDGGYFPVGGAGAVLEHIAPVIQQSGGKIVTDAEVIQVDVEDHQARGVRLSDGRFIPAPIVVSGVGVRNTFGRLLAADVAAGLAITDKVTALEPSHTHMALFVGFQKSDDELGLPIENIFLYPDNYDHEQNLARFLADREGAELPITYITSTSAKEPGWSRRYPGRSTLEVISAASYEWFAQWEDEPRGEAYEAYKEKWSRRLLARLYEFMPHLEGEVDYYELWTPLTTRDVVNYPLGEMFGLAHTPKRVEARFLRAHTPIQGLFLTGQDVVTGGLMGAAGASVVTSSAILKQNVITKLG